MFDGYARYRAILADLRDAVWQRLGDRIVEQQPRLVGIHAKTSSIVSALNIARIAKARLGQSAKVVLGGPHPTILPEETCAHPDVDFVVAGEGEQTLAQLCAAVAGGSELESIDGLVWKKGHTVIVNKPRSPLEDLDSLPFPEREHVLDRQSYPADAFGLIITARGCPFRCTYCASHKIWGRRVRYRSAENVLGEVRFVKERYGTNYFKISDDTFTVNGGRAADICDRLISERLDIRWQCYTRTDCVDVELARKMRKAGCELALVGVESGSPRMLETIKKGETVEKMRAGIRILKGAGIAVSVFLMMGFPEETEEEVLQSLAFAVSLNPGSIVANILTPYPGTEIFEELARKGLIQPPVHYEEFFHQSPLMGIGSHIPPDRFAELKSLFIRKAEEYNIRAARTGKIKRGLKMLFTNPAGFLKRIFR